MNIEKRHGYEVIDLGLDALMEYASTWSVNFQLIQMVLIYFAYLSLIKIEVKIAYLIQ